MLNEPSGICNVCSPFMTTLFLSQTSLFSILILVLFFTLRSGVILLDGRDIRTLNVHWLRRQFAVVFQHPQLFQLSIKENVKLGNLAADQRRINAALEVANAAAFVRRLPDKEDTLVGDQGFAAR